MKTTLLIGMISAAIALPAAAIAQPSAKEREERRDKRDDRRDKRKDKREERRDKREDRREKREDRREDKREDRREKREEKREDRRENLKDKRKDLRDGRRDARKDRRHHRERFTKLRQRMAVSSFAPRMGPAGTTVVIRGQNFPKGATVTLAGQPVSADVSPRRISFKVPKRAKDGAIVVKGGGSLVVVGSFDTKGRRDNKEWKKRRLEREKRARERLKARWSKRASDRAERRKAYEARQAELEETRVRRARERSKRIRARWERAFLASEPVQTELALHAARRARLERMQRLADIDDREKLSLRIEVLIDKEDARHERRMKLLKTNFKG